MRDTLEELVARVAELERRINLLSTMEPTAIDADTLGGYAPAQTGASAHVLVTQSDGGIAASGPIVTVQSVSTDNGSTDWQLGGYASTAPLATGYITVNINTVGYKLLASNV